MMALNDEMSRLTLGSSMLLHDITEEDGSSVADLSSTCESRAQSQPASQRALTGLLCWWCSGERRCAVGGQHDAGQDGGGGQHHLRLAGADLRGAQCHQEDLGRLHGLPHRPHPTQAKDRKDRGTAWCLVLGADRPGDRSRCTQCVSLLKPGACVPAHRRFQGARRAHPHLHLRGTQPCSRD